MPDAVPVEPTAEPTPAPLGTPDNPAQAPEVHTRTGGNLPGYKEVAERALHALETRIPDAEKVNGKLAEELRDLRSAVDQTNDRYKMLWDRQIQSGGSSASWGGETINDTRVLEGVGDRIMIGFRAAKAHPEAEHGPWVEICRRAAENYEETDSLGGITTPTLTTPEVFRYQKEKTLARLLCRVIPAGSDKIDVPSLPSDPSAYYVSQGNAPAASAMTFGTDQVTVKTLMALATIQGELLEDTVVNFMQFWGEVFLDVFSLKENKAVFSEDPNDTNSAFTGAVQAVAAYNSGSNICYLGDSATSGNTHFSTVSYDDLVNVQNTVAEEARDGCIWAGNKAAYRWLQALRTTDGYPLIGPAMNGMPAPNPVHAPELPRPSTLLGDPFYVTSAMPAHHADPGLAMLVYGNFRKGHLFMPRTDYQVQVSTEAAFSTGGSMVRARERYTTHNILPAGFATLNIANS